MLCSLSVLNVRGTNSTCSFLFRARYPLRRAAGEIVGFEHTLHLAGRLFAAATWVNRDLLKSVLERTSSGLNTISDASFNE